MDLEGLVRRHRLSLQPAAVALSGWGAFDLDVPCVVMDAEQDCVLMTVIGKLSAHLPTSCALASEPMERFLRLKESVGFDAAFEAMSADDEEGEAFVREWDQAMEDLEGGVLVSLNDVVAMVEQAKQGWQERPRKLLVVGVEGRQVCSALVSIAVLSA